MLKTGICEKKIARYVRLEHFFTHDNFPVKLAFYLVVLIRDYNGDVGSGLFSSRAVIGQFAC